MSCGLGVRVGGAAAGITRGGWPWISCRMLAVMGRLADTAGTRSAARTPLCRPGASPPGAKVAVAAAATAAVVVAAATAAFVVAASTAGATATGPVGS